MNRRQMMMAGLMALVPAGWLGKGGKKKGIGLWAGLSRMHAELGKEGIYVEEDGTIRWSKFRTSWSNDDRKVINEIMTRHLRRAGHSPILRKA